MGTTDPLAGAFASQPQNDDPLAGAFAETPDTPEQAALKGAQSDIANLGPTKALKTSGKSIVDFTGKVLDLLSRGQYASAKVADSLATDGFVALGSALKAGMQEALDPKERLSYSEVMKKHNPEYAAAHPYATEVMGFLADVALDPVTYLTVGTGKAIKVVGEPLSKAGRKALGMEIASQAKKFAQEGGYSTKLAGEAVSERAVTKIRESAEATIEKMMATDPSLIDKGGIKFAGQTVVPGAVFDYAKKALGVAVSPLKGTKVYQDLRDATGILRRNLSLPEEYIDIRKTIEAEYSRMVEETEDVVKKVFSGLPKDERVSLGSLAHTIQESTNSAIEQLGRQLNPRELQQIRHSVLGEVKLSDKSLAAYSEMQRLFKESGENEMAVGLLDVMVQNYTPRMYNLMKNGADFIAFQRTHNSPRLSTFLSAAEGRVFETLDQAKAAGYVPELDAAILTAQRVIQSRKAVAKEYFNESTRQLFGGQSMIPKRVAEDIHFVGEGLYGRSLPEAARKALNFYDRAQSIFKTFATAVNPAFGPKQFVSNSVQGFVAQGVKAFKMFDPRAAMDAAAYVSGHLPDRPIVSNLGDIYGPDDVAALLKEHNIVRGTNIAGEKFNRNLTGQLRNEMVINRATMGNEAAEGAVKFMAGMANHLNWPSAIEDWSRVSLFMNGLRMGHAPKDAARLTEKALFDYTNGLSQIETRFIKRIVPFYSFQRFAYPLVAETIATTPGRVSALKKGADAFFTGWNKRAGGETLTPAEQTAIPGYIQEQPGFFEKFDPQVQAVFKSFNNFSPLDVLNGIQLDEKGGMDMAQTMQKATLAQITPFLKMPIELLVKKRFFDDRVLRSDTSRGITDLKAEIGRVGKVKPDELIGNMVALMGAKSGGVIGATLGKLVGDLTGKMVPEEAFKKLIGYQTGTTPDGQETSYVNPFMFYVLSSLAPTVNEVVRQSREDLTPLEKVQSLFGGIRTSKIDLAKSARITSLQQVKSIRAAQSDIKRAGFLGLSVAQAQAEDQLRELLQSVSEYQDKIGSGVIRGADPLVP